MDYTLLFDAFAESHADLGWPRQRLLHECLRAAIRDGTLAAGTRLASSRTLATELKVARNSVLYAYEQLASEGYVLGDRRGTVVAAIASRASAEAVAPADASPHQLLSRRARNLRPVLGPADMMGAFAPGVPALDAFPLALWRRMLERAWRTMTPRQLNYGDPRGEPALRTAVADYLRASRGVLCDASQVLITDGTQSSLDLCARACADEGDTVWMEDPGYAGALAAFRGAGLKIAGIPLDEEGIAPQPSHWHAHPPRLIYTTPSHQYPVGTVMSLRRRLALIADARAAGALIIEDDYDSEFRHDGPPLPAMQGLAPDAPVLYLGTFSKTMFPALRIGYVVVPPWLAAPLADMRAQSAARGRAAEQLAVAEFLRSGQFALHLRRMRRLYRQRRDALQQALERHVGAVAVVEGASAGMHLALRFIDPALDDQAVTARLLEAGVIVNALSVHAVGDAQHGNGRGNAQCSAHSSGLMLGYAQVPAERMEELAHRVAAAVY